MWQDPRMCMYVRDVSVGACEAVLLVALHVSIDLCLEQCVPVARPGQAIVHLVLLLMFWGACRAQ